MSSFGIEEGLSNRDVQCLHQDKQGFIWCGTKNGLNRFDGLNFKTYTSKNHGLASDEVNSILEDVNGRLWLFDTGFFFRKEVRSITIFDPNSEKIFPLSSLEGLPDLQNKKIVSFTQNPEGHISLLLDDGTILVFNGQFIQHKIDLEPFDRIEDFLQDSDGNYLIAAKNRVDNLERLGIEIYYYSIKNGFTKNHKFEKAAQCLFFISKENISSFLSYGSSGPQLYEFRNDGSIEQNFEIVHSLRNTPNFSVPFTSLSKFIDRKEGYWIMNFQSKEERTLLTVSSHNDQYESKVKEVLKDLGGITNILFLNESEIWFATQFGIKKIEIYKNNFEKILYSTGDYLPAIRNITNDKDGNIYFVEEGYSYIWKYDTLEQSVKKINDVNLAETAIPVNSRFNVLQKTRNDQLQYASSKELITFDPISFEYSTTSLKFPGEAGMIWSLYEDEDETIWIGSDRGYLGYTENGVSKYITALNGDKLIVTYQFLSIEPDRLHLATSDGLYIIDKENKSVLDHYSIDQLGYKFLPTKNIHHILQGKDCLWLSTGGDGLIKWYNDRNSVSSASSFEQYTNLEGLSSNTIYAAYPDMEDNLWLSSANGIMKFNTITSEVETYLEKDGITHNEFNRISHHQTKDGKIYFGGLNGITAFHPDKIVSKRFSSNPPLRITTLQHYDKNGEIKPQSLEALLKESEIIILPSDRLVHLEFELLSFENSDKNHYAYQFEKLDPDWIYQKENSLRFSHLPYGVHNLLIKGQSFDGAWSAKQLSIKIKVLKPFYLKAWFLFLSLFILGLGIYSYYKWRLSVHKNHALELENEVKERTKKISQDKVLIEKQAEELRSLDKIKSRFFTNISHELRTPLSLIDGPVKTLLLKKTHDPKDVKLLQFIERNSGQLKKLVDEILDLTKLDSNKLRLNEEMVDFYPYLKNRIDLFFSIEDDPRISFIREEETESSTTILLDKVRFEKILNNLISNALKFTPKEGRVEVIAKETDKDILIEVRDNGEGIHKDDLPFIFERFFQSSKPKYNSKGGTGIGLALCKELVTLMQGKIWVSSVLGKGSSFYFSIPKKSNIDSAYQKPKFSSDLYSEHSEKELNALENVLVTAQETKGTILIVEDNEDLREYYKIILENYTIHTVSNGAEAIESLTNGIVPDLIISDLMMPIMDGMELLTKLKKSEKWNGISFIMITAKHDQQVKISALRYGIDDYLNKPFDEIELVVRVNNLIENQIKKRKFNYKESSKMLTAHHQNDPIVQSHDRKWLKEFETYVLEHINSDQLNVASLAKAFVMSESTLLRKTKKLTGLTPKQYIQEVKLNQAKEFILKEKFKTISEVAYYFGYKDVSSFDRSYKQRFGKSPSQTLKAN